jgi:membrane protease YdiL (CAAX protease family)
MRGKSILEVIVFFIGMYLIGWAMELTGVFQWEREVLGFNWIFPLFSLSMILLILSLTKRNFKSYGFSTRTWQFELDLGLTSMLFYIPPFLLGFSLLMHFNTTYDAFPGGLIMAAIEIGAIFLIFAVIKKRYSDKGEEKRYDTKFNLIIMVLLLLLPLILGFSFGKSLPLIASTIIWQFCISGFGEEIRYRGYFQSRINEEFGRPYKFLGVNFGIGLIIASVLFAISHILNPFNPFAGQTELAWFWGLWTFFSGILYGLLREKTNTILACALLHGLTGAVGESLALVFGWTV